MSNDNAVSFHEKVSLNFQKNYTKDHFNERLVLFVRLVEKYVYQNSTVIDLGCGPGVISIGLSPKVNKIIGIDGSANMIALAEEMKKNSKIQNCDFIEGNIPEVLDLIDMKIDCIISSSVLEYLTDLPKTLKKINDKLKPGGIFIVSMPNPISIFRRFEKFIFKFLQKPAYLNYSINHLRPPDFQNILEDNNFEVIEIDYFAKKGFIFKILDKILPVCYTNNMFVCVCKTVSGSEKLEERSGKKVVRLR